MGLINSKLKNNQYSGSPRANNNSKKPKNANVLIESKQTSDSEDEVKTVVYQVDSFCKWHIANLDILLRAEINPSLIVLIFEYGENPVNIDVVRNALIDVEVPDYFGIFKPDQDYIAKRKAEALAHYRIWTACPLDTLVVEATKNPNALLRSIIITNKLDGIEFTFEGSPLQLAIMLLDQTIQSAEGQAERIMALIQELTPEKMLEAQKQARLAARVVDESKFKDEEAKRLEVLNNAFNQIKANKFDAAGKIIRDHIIGTKPAVIKDNQYFLNLLRLIHMAIIVIIDRADELVSGLRGKQADEYCFKIIGEIERVLPYKLRKILITGLFSILYEGKPIERGLLVNDFCYLRDLDGNVWELASNRFYDEISGRMRVAPGKSLVPCHLAFEALIINIIRAAESMQRSNTQENDTVIQPNRPRSS